LLPVDASASLAWAQAEYQFWQSHASAIGGFLGPMVGPEMRDQVQKVLGNPGSAGTNSVSEPGRVWIRRVAKIHQVPTSTMHLRSRVRNITGLVMMRNVSGP
jgi:hypothetical protein